jgi:hypothetical protein
MRAAWVSTTPSATAANPSSSVKWASCARSSAATPALEGVEVSVSSCGRATSDSPLRGVKYSVRSASSQNSTSMVRARSSANARWSWSPVAP